MLHEFFLSIVIKNLVGRTSVHSVHIKTIVH